jgi:hypothetical protein
MRKISIIIFLIYSLSISSQNDTRFSRFYGRVAFSYSIGTNQSLYLFDPLNSSEFNSNSYTTPVFGNGVSYIAGLGYKLTKNIAIESNFSILNGNETPLFSYLTPTKYVQASMIDNRQFLFQPTAVISADFKKFHPYIKVGLVIPLYNQSTFQYIIQSVSNNKFKNKYTYQIENQLNLGLNGCIGIAYSISDKVELFVEAEESNTRSFHIKTSGLIADEVGTWLPPNSIQSYYYFVSSKDINTNNQNDLLNFPISFGRQSYNFGFKYNF